MKRLVYVALFLSCFSYADKRIVSVETPLKVRSAYDSRFYVETNLEFTLLHELAHAVIELNDIPVLGGHEKAADQIAIMLMIMTSDGLEPSLFDKMLSISGEWMIEWRQEINRQPLIFWGVHPLAIQRFYDVTCLMYGSAPEQLEKIRNEVWLPIERAWECDKEYRQNRDALLWLAENHSYVSFDRDWKLIRKTMPVVKQERVKVHYTRPSRDRHQSIHNWLTQSVRIKRLMQRINQTLKLPEPITVYFESLCDGPDAWWNPNVNGIILCYSLIEQFENNSKALKPLVSQLGQEEEKAYLFLFPAKYSWLLSQKKERMKKSFLEIMDSYIREQ